jgi:hypothetical protein
MRVPDYQIMLFDLKKYREIQPIVENAANQSGDYQPMIPLVRTAIKNVEHDDFEKYNDPDEREHFLEDFQKMLGVLQKKEFVPWIHDIRNRDIFQEVIFLICCPDFQELSTYNKKSGTRIDYGDILYGTKICDLDLIEVLENIESEGEISCLSSDTNLYVLSQEQITAIDKSVPQDILTLTQLENSLDYRQPIIKESYLEFYFNLKNLIDRVKSNNNYTLLSERYYE